MELEIKSLAETSFDELYICFSEAFKDYPFQWSREALARTLHRRNVRFEFSYGAFHNQHLVSFLFNGIEHYRGHDYAYDAGTGTIETFRKQGLSSTIFDYARKPLLEAGITHYLLEVLSNNAAAISVYQKQGFHITRTFRCFLGNQEDLRFPETRTELNPYECRETDWLQSDIVLSWCDSYPSWQNHFISLKKQPDRFKTIGVFKQDELLGMGILETDSGDIPLLVIHPNERNQGLGKRLFQELQTYNTSGIVKIVNVDSNASACLRFIERLGIPQNAEQFEMEKSLKTS